MRWSIIRTIWLREMRDQMRDRRTLVMVLGLPLFLYPLLGFAFMQFTFGAGEKPLVIGVVTGSERVTDFPVRQPKNAGCDVRPVLTWLAVTPETGSLSGAAVLACASQLALDYPQFIEDGQLTVFNTKMPRSEARAAAAQARLKIKFLEHFDARMLAEREVDLILEAPADFFRRLDAGDHLREPERSILHIHHRPNDERSRMALRRLMSLVQMWKNDIKRVRMARAGLTEPFLEPIDVRLSEESTRPEAQLDLVLRVFPVLLVMWSLAGAFYPAVDLCAGEKERGTMETLLITPAGREEIVLGKFLTIWVLSAGTSLLNLVSMGVTTAQFAAHVPNASISWAGLMWCVLLSLPQSAFFSALALAIGAYARSSKEGQYYLMPLFVVTMPLALLTMSPGIELNPLYSLIPVTGVALLMQKVATAQSLGEIPWAYFIPVLAPIALYSVLALRWAIEQFNREGVLFREAERLDLTLWIRSLFRDKEMLPTAGQAFFAIAVLIGLRWLSMLGMGTRWTLEIRTVISQLALVATPPLVMALLLNTQPGAGLYLRWPKGRETILAAILALLMLPPMIGMTQAIVWRFPNFLEGAHPMIEVMRGIHEGRHLDSWQLMSYLFAFALVPAVCEEIAFRGFVLCGLHHGFRPRNAVFLSSFFFALFHLNVFLFVPTFILGVALGLLTIRSRSLLPAILFHFLHNAALISLMPLSQHAEVTEGWAQDAWAWVIGLCLVLAFALVWWLYRKPYVDLARREAAEAAARAARGG